MRLLWNVEKLGHMHQAYVPTVSTTRKPSKSHVNGYCTLLSVSALPRIELVPTFSTCDLLLVVVACFSSFSPVVGIACLNSWLLRLIRHRVTHAVEEILPQQNSQLD